MLTNPETSHLRKYLATLGVSLMLGSLGVGGFLLRNTNDLMVTTEQLTKLTPLARDAIEHRQAVSYTASIIAPYLVLLGGLFGLTLTLFGLIGWARRQKVADRTEDLEQTRIETEIRQLTESERIERAEQEVALDPFGAAPPASAPPGSTQPGELPAPAAQSPPIGQPQGSGIPPPYGHPQPDDDATSTGNDQPEPGGTAGGYPYPSEKRSEQILLASSALSDKLTAVFKGRDISTEVRIDTPNGQVAYADAVVLPSREADGYVVELKVVPPYGDSTRRIRETREEARNLARMLDESNGQGTLKPVAVIVHDDDSPPPSMGAALGDADDVRTLIFGFDSFLKTPGAKLRAMIEAD